MHFVLASASLRRQELLQRMNIPYEIIVSDFDEDTVPFEGNPEYYVKKLAEEKANSVSKVLSDDAVVIGADTIVFADGSSTNRYPGNMGIMIFFRRSFRLLQTSILGRKAEMDFWTSCV